MLSSRYYEGQLNEQNKIHGYGKLSLSNGDNYEGEFKEGKYHGKGVITRMNARDNIVIKKYEGNFHNGFIIGEGKLTHLNGPIYEGNFDRVSCNGKKKACYHGYGKLSLSNGDVYEGDFHEGMYHGVGIFKYSNGDVYDGQFEKNLYHGNGILTYANGDKYMGEFEKGEKKKWYEKPKQKNSFSIFPFW